MYEYIIHCILIIFWAFFYPLFSQLIQGNCWEIHLLNNGGHSTSSNVQDVLRCCVRGVLRVSPWIAKDYLLGPAKNTGKHSE